MIGINILIMTSIKTQVVFPDDLLEALDAIVQKRERSDFVVQAVREKLQRLKLQEMLRQTAGIWKDHPEFRTDRDVRKYLKRLRGADTARNRTISKARRG